MSVTKREKRERMLTVIERLKAVYPDAECALLYNGDPWRLLVMGRLSAQCTDKRVNEVSEELFTVFPNAEAMAEGDISEIERIVKPCGLYRMKAANIRDASRMLVEHFGGELPDNMYELLTLPGVGRKIANLLLGDIFKLPAIVCDTHMIRICGRLGMYKESLKDPTKIEFILKELVPPEEGSDLCHRVVLFGRDRCSARGPVCEGCPLADVCEHVKRG
ncbi:MAG: endonuclease III [Clostridia bacterium]|nr:endonuclease III [Clostridia bacterium]